MHLLIMQAPNGKTRLTMTTLNEVIYATVYGITIMNEFLSFTESLFKMAMPIFTDGVGSQL